MRPEKLVAPFQPPEAKDITSRLEFWADTCPDQLAFRFLRDGENDELDVTFGQLAKRSKAIAASLQESGLTGERALLLYPPGLEFVEAFFGCLFAGVTAVPAFPPRRNRNGFRIQSIVDDCGAQAALTVDAILERSQASLNETTNDSDLRWIATDAVDRRNFENYSQHTRDSNDLAVLQYTSGSTGSPKGVMLAHGNIVHNLSLITTAFQATPNDLGMSWLPTYHDMGLVGGILNPVYCGCPSLLMSPMMFLQKPLRWLRAITKHAVTISGGPNFAYDLCTKKIREDEIDDLDLSTWTLAFNGAEPVRPQTLEAFAKKFERCGFRKEAFYPCYGMAETTLIVTGGDRSLDTTIRCFDGSALDEGRVLSAAPDGDQGRFLVSCGGILDGERIVVVDPDTRTKVSEGRVGEIWISSDSVGKGYWDKPDATCETFQSALANGDNDGHTYLRSGDLGFLTRDELFVTGRLKDMIIVRGVNRYPQDIEMTVERADRRLRSGAAAAFAVDIEDRERLVVVSEVERGTNDDWSEVFDAIRRDVTTEHELPPEGIVLVRAGSIPKTSSGKIQRHACRTAFLEGTLLSLARRCDWEIEKNRAERNGKSEVAEKAATNGRSDGHAQPSIIDVVMQKVREVADERARVIEPDTNIVDLGLDSLERMEIINELEEHFGGQFPEEVLPQIETCREVAAAVEKYIGLVPTSKKDRKIKDIPEGHYRFDKMPEYAQLRRNSQILQSTGLPNPFFKRHESVTRDTAVINGREMINFSSYNYLGMSGDPDISKAAQAAIEQFGTSVSASRLVSGEKTIHSELESEIADFVGTESSIIYVGGHSTNETTIGHLFGQGDLILHDALSHNSIIQGAILSGARRRPFPHNDWKTLNELLTELRHDYRRVLVVVEGVYSMDGDYPDLPKFVEARNHHRTFLMVDEAHSIGTMGKTGRGLGEFYGVDPSDVDLWMGTLSKSFGSCGGYIAGCNELIQYLKYSAPGFVYSVGLSPPNVAAALASIRKLKAEPERAEKCISNARLFLKLAKEKGLATGLSQNTPIVPVITGDSLVALTLSHMLGELGINVQPILYPAVEESAARLRFFITSCHSEEQIRYTVDSIAKSLEEIRAVNSSQPSAPAAPHLTHSAVTMPQKAAVSK